MNRYKEPEEKEDPDSSYIVWKNPRKTGEYQTEKYQSKHEEQKHFDALMSLQDRRYNLNLLLGDFMQAVEVYENSDDMRKLEQVIREIIDEPPEEHSEENVVEPENNGQEEPTQEEEIEFILECNFCDRKFSSDDYESIERAHKARGGHMGSAHPEQYQ